MLKSKDRHMDLTCSIVANNFSEKMITTVATVILSASIVKPNFSKRNINGIENFNSQSE